jgi:drug/metabolite transporter (DMT)-like permease
MLDLPVEDRSSACGRLGSGLDRLSQWLMKESAFMFTRRNAGLLLIAISAASFGVMPILARFAYTAGADPITTLWLRFGIAAVVMTAIMLVRRMPFPRGRVLLWLVLMGRVGYAGVSLAYFTALTMASAGLVALLLYLYPALVMVLSVVFLRERLSRVKVGVLLLALLGTALTTGLVGGASALGIFLGFAAALLYAIYILVGSHVVHRAGSIASSTIVMISAATSYSGMVIIHGPALPQSMPVGSGEIICTFFLVLIEHLFLYIDIFHLYYPLVSAFSHTFQCCRADCSSAYERNNHRHSVRIFLSFSRTDMLSSQHKVKTPAIEEVSPSRKSIVVRA